MIVNLPVDSLYDDGYQKTMEEFDALRSKQLARGFEIDRVGTGSLFYAISNSFLSRMGSGSRLHRYANFLNRKIMFYLIRSGRIVPSSFNVVWTKDVVKSSTLPYPIRRVEYPWALQNADLRGPTKILDVGSGISLFPIYLALQGHEVFSIDNDRILMERLAPRLARWTGANVTYSLGNATSLEFEDNTFDRVFCISVLEHLEEENIGGVYVNYRKKNLDVKAIGEMLRVLKPGGRLVLTFDWSESPEEKRSYRLQDVYERVLAPYRSLLIKDEKPEIDWEQLKQAHIKAWKSFPPFTYVTEGWALGVVLQKK
jgi:ubiquinone/menaquinone biosynthesis C-methylase UbiE